jgi:predicted GNAT family acetyltransferase
MKFKFDGKKLSLIDDNTIVGTTDYLLGDNVFTILKVYVLPIFQGKGYAKLMVEEIVRLAKEKGYKIKPICSYSVGYFEKNPQYGDLLIK